MLTNCVCSYVQRSVLLGFACPEAGGKPSVTAQHTGSVLIANLLRHRPV